MRAWQGAASDGHGVSESAMLSVIMYGFNLMEKKGHILKLERKVGEPPNDTLQIHYIPRLTEWVEA